MIKEKKICWLLKINNTQNVRFCQKYNNTNELNLEDNKKIIDRLYKEDTKEICWIGDEAISYPNFIELVKYSKERSIRNKILFNNISNCKIEEIMKIVKYVDYITVTLDSIEEDVNEKLGKGKEYYKEICKYLKLLQDQVQINILTMINSQNAIEQKKIEEELFKFRIDSWIILGFMPILLDREADVEDLKVSKINCKFYYTLPWLLFNRLKHFYTLTEYTIARKYSIILPNGDIAVMNESESFVIGNILKETKERIEKNYNNKRRYLIPKQSEQKIRIFIANSNEEIINEIISVSHNVYDKPKDEKGRWFIGTTKTSSGKRKIHISKTLLEALKNYKNKKEYLKSVYGESYKYYHLENVVNDFGKVVEYRIVKNDNNVDVKDTLDLVFTREDGSYTGTDITRYPFKVIHEELGIKKCRFYDLRGSYATKTLKNGSEIRDVADILGHKNIETTENYYISSTEDSRKQTNDSFEGTIKSNIINSIIKYAI